MSFVTAMVSQAERIAEEVARPAAASVDRDARFPHEAVAALRQEGLMAAAIPRELGGAGSSAAEIAAVCAALGRACPSTAAIFAMQQVQLICLARHSAGAPFFVDYLRQAAAGQWLIASGSSEVGVGGDVRTSIAAIEPSGSSFSLRKRCSVLSYGEQADAILITARRAADAAPGDQVMALLRKQDYQLTPAGRWDALGMRGTCSPPFEVAAEASMQQILPHAFRAVALQTFVPYSCIAWSAGWLGIAEAAVSIARSFVRREAGKRPGVTPFGAPRLAQVVNDLETMRTRVEAGAQEYDRLDARDDRGRALSSISYALRVNGLKLASAQLVVQICLSALEVCGVPGYLNDSEFSIGRLLRDALAAPLMIGNDRLITTNANLLVVHPDDPD
jgi:acyl-CoA dehydrogenase